MSVPKLLKICCFPSLSSSIVFQNFTFFSPIAASPLYLPPLSSNISVYSPIQSRFIMISITTIKTIWPMCFDQVKSISSECNFRVSICVLMRNSLCKGIHLVFLLQVPIRQ